MAEEVDPSLDPYRTYKIGDVQYTDKYSVEAYTFPEDLFSNKAPYGNSWVMININAQDISKYNSLYKRVAVYENKDFSNTRNIPNITGNEVAAVAVVGSVAVGAVSSTFSSLKDTLNSGGKVNPARLAGEALAATAKGAVAGGFAALPFLASGQANRKTSRIDTAIMLPMPSSLITGYMAEWGESDTALLNAALRLGGVAKDAIKGAFSGDYNAFSNIAGQGITELSEAATQASLASQNMLGAGGISAATGLASNSKKEMIFNGVGFRTFTLEYKLYPKTQSEVAKIYAIINTLKFHMHPEYKSEGRYTFIYPSEFDISFMHNENENFWVNRIATSVLKNLSVNYTPEGLWAQHGGSLSGSPTALTINMTFQELSILTKETVSMGY